MDEVNSLKQLVALANGLLKNADTGREYTMEYVVNRLQTALDEYPHDSVIRSVANVIEKQAIKGKLTTSQKELYNIYNHFAGLNANSMIKEAIGDILYPIENVPRATVSNQTEYTFRNTAPELDFKIEHNPLNNLFENNVEAGSYYDPTLAKLGKHAIMEELNGIGVPATEIKTHSGVGDNVAIVYDVSFTNKLGTAHIPFFVEVKDGVQTPTHFYSNQKFIQLTAENLNRVIVEKAEQEEIKDLKVGGVMTASSVISPSFAFEEDAPAEIKLDAVAMPDALQDLASFNEAVLDAGTAFSPELVRTAKAICFRELAGMGFNGQVKLAEATDNCIICAAELNSSAGKVEIKLPVEIINDRPQIPALFYDEMNKDKIYDFTRAELHKYLTANKLDNANIVRYSVDFFDMTYNQLKEEILNGIATKNYVRAEEALNRIEDKFGSDSHRMALADYAKYLTHSSVDDVEKPQNKCRLLITKGSIEPRCGHYNVPANRVLTNEYGECELIERKAKYDNLAESTGVLFNTSKINLT